MSNKQSSVEWLVKKLADLTFSYIAGFLTTEEYDTQSNKVIEQAKEMHKEEIINAWRKGDGVYDKVSKQMSVQYYNQTYGGNNEME